VQRVVYHLAETADDDRSDYFARVLELALAKTAATDGPAVAEPIELGYTQSKVAQALTRRWGRIDVGSFASTAELERRLIPVRIPLMRGLLGFRLFIVHRAALPLFAEVRTLDDLLRLRPCAGTDWPDVEILRAAGFDPVTSWDYEALFRLVRERRCDFFPRGAPEPFQELPIRQLDHPELVVEPNLALRYPLPIYFFVGRHNAALADRIERGLRLALADGSFTALFTGYRTHQRMFVEAGLSRRLVFDIPNPLLPPLTPLDDPTLWLDDIGLRRAEAESRAALGGFAAAG